MDVRLGVCIVHRSVPLQARWIFQRERKEGLPVWMQSDFPAVLKESVFRCYCHIGFLASKGYVDLQSGEFVYRSPVCMHGGQDFSMFLMPTDGEPVWACSHPECQDTQPARFFDHRVSPPEVVEALIKRSIELTER